MTDTVTESATADDQAEPSLESAAVEQKLIEQLVAQARSKGLQLTGEGGLLQQLAKTVLESALEGEITDHLGYGKHDPAGKDGGNSRYGTRSKTVLTDIGPVEIDVPRDREGSFELAIVKKRQRGLTGVDEMVLSRVLSELKNRGVDDVLMLVCDGLKGLPAAVCEVWPRTVVQTCVVHLLRASFRYAAR